VYAEVCPVSSPLQYEIYGNALDLSDINLPITDSTYSLNMIYDQATSSSVVQFKSDDVITDVRINVLLWETDKLDE